MVLPSIPSVVDSGKTTVKKTGDLAKKNKKTGALTGKSDTPYGQPEKA